jgi:hypothetical protein
MSPDGHPVYDRSRSDSGAYLVTCYRGATLAVIGAGPAWAQRRRPPGRGANPRHYRAFHPVLDSALQYQ